MDSPSPSPASGSRVTNPSTPMTIQIPSSLKFLINSIKTLVQTPLNAENYLYWSSQVSNLFNANGFSSYLDTRTTIPDSFVLDNAGLLSPNPLFDQWNLIDKNLRAVIISTITPSVLPHVLTLPTTADMWHCLQDRFQSTNRSRIMHLKQSLQQVSLKSGSMESYLTEIKRIVHLLAASGDPTFTADVILYTLNGLPPTYNSFQTSIRTRPGPLSLDEFYSLLSSEELHISRIHAQTPPIESYALYSSSTRPNRPNYRGRGRSNRDSRLPQSNRPPTLSPSTNRTFNTAPPPSDLIICQICAKPGHSARRCWYRGDYQNHPSSSPSPKQAYQSTSTITPPADDWYLDSGATDHLTSSFQAL